MGMWIFDKTPTFLADGRAAESLRLGELFRALQDMGIPGIDGAMNKPDLLRRYRELLVPVAVTMKRPRTYIGKDLDAELLKMAAKAIAKGGRDSNAVTRRPGAPPTIPIASTAG